MTVREANLTPASSADREPEMIESGGNARLHLTLATTDYDHVRDLVNGVIRPEGITLTAFVLPVEEVFYRFIKNQEWDISEMSFGKFIGFASQGTSPFVGIPVFPSRVFRHSAFYVRADRGIGTPKDLEGKRVGIPEWAQTAGIYARGFMAETAGVDLRKIHWVQAGMNEAGREEKVEFKLPAGIQYQQRRDTSISAMLLSGEIDAAIIGPGHLINAGLSGAEVVGLANFNQKLDFRLNSRPDIKKPEDLRGKRIAVTIAGFAVLLVGLAGLVLPVLPGWILIFVGLGILATEYVWAQRLLNTAKEKANQAKDAVMRKNKKQDGDPVA